MAFARKLKRLVKPRSGSDGGSDSPQLNATATTQAHDLQAQPTRRFSTVFERPRHHPQTEADAAEIAAQRHDSSFHETWNPGPSTNIYQNQSTKVAIQGQVTVQGNQNIYMLSPPSIIRLRFNKAKQVHRTNDESHGLRSPVADSSSGKSLTEVEQDFLSRLGPTALYGRQTSVVQRTAGTLTWLSQEAEYRAWNSSVSPCVLLVTGHPGCGKSVLSSHVCTSTTESPRDGIVCRYFFDATVAASANACTLLRSLIHQIVTSQRKLLKIARGAIQKYQQALTDRTALWDLFNRLVRHQRVKGLILIVDAVDECLETDQDWLIRRLDALLNADGVSSLKILLTSRLHCAAAAAIEECTTEILYLRLECRKDVLEKDVAAYIQDAVQRLVREHRCSKQNGAILERILLERSEATFLWVSLAICLFQQRRHMTDNDLEKIMNQLPPELSKMYESLLEAIPEDDRPRAQKTMSMLRCCYRLLSVKELDIMLSIDDTDQCLGDLREKYTFQDMEEIESLLRGLVRASGSQVALIHHTLQEYFVESERSGQSSRWLYASGKVDHAVIAESCMRYLLLEEFQHDISVLSSMTTPTSPTCSEPMEYESQDSDPSEADSYLGTLFQERADVTFHTAIELGDQYKLFDYAARFWPFHFEKCQGEKSTEMDDLAIRLCAVTTPRSWLDYVSILNIDSNSYPAMPGTLTLLSYFGHLNAVKTLITSASDNLEPAALFWASRNGHTLCVIALLTHKSSPGYWTSFEGRSPLAIAATQGHVDCVDLMISAGTFKVNEIGRDNRTALSFAASGAHVSVVSRILLEHDADPNLVDRSGASPIFWAVSADSLETVKRLLEDSRTMPEHVDLNMRSALSWACEYGFEAIVQCLISDSRTRTDEKDAFGQTPLLHAVRSGNLAVVKLLAKRAEVNVSAQDGQGRNAISWAAQKSDPSILRYLMQVDRTGATVPDLNGWTPLAWTLDPPERVLNASILLSRTFKAFDDASGLEMFALALSWGSFAIAHLLLSRGVFHINARTETGRTALSFAAESGHVELVRQLLSKEGVIVDIADHSGGTPLEIALEAGHDEVCNLLVDGRQIESIPKGEFRDSSNN